MFRFTQLVAGVPARSTTHGGFGWSSVGLLEGEGRRILVDTGPPAYIALLHRELERCQMVAADITDVLVTHLHWDHVGNVTMFPNAQVTVSGAEMEWAASQPPGTIYVPDLHVARLMEQRDRLRFVEDGDEPIAGLTIVGASGHTPGHLAFDAQTDSGHVIFAGDAVKNRHELATSEVEWSMDAEASLATTRRIRQRLVDDPSAVLVPGHDVRLAVRDGVVTPLDSHACAVEVLVTNTGGPQSRILV